MRRKDREITDYSRMIEIMKQCDCCRIAFEDTPGPYIVPLSFGFKENMGALSLYFHGAGEGKKLELLKRQPWVGFELDTKHKLVEGDGACTYTFLYQSIIGKGKLEIIQDYDDKVTGLKIIMSQYTDKKVWEFNRQAVDRVVVLKLTVSEWSCKEQES